MNSRILPPEEWHRLDGTEAEQLWPTLDPQNVRVVAVEDGDELVSCWVAMRVVHMECLWVKPSHRGLAGVARRLFAGLRQVAVEWDLRGVVTSSLSPVVTDLIRRFGGSPLPGEMFVLPIEIGRPVRKAEEEACPLP